MSDRPGPTTQSHEWYEELLGAYALGALLPEETAAIEAHLATCPTCPGELRLIRRGVRAYALTADERSPSPELRDRLWSAISAPPLTDTNTAPDQEDEAARMDDEGGPASDSSEAYPAEPPEADIEPEPDSVAAPTARPFQRPEPFLLSDKRPDSHVAISPIWARIAAALVVILIGSLVAWNITLRDDSSSEGKVVGQFTTTADAPSPDIGGDVRYLKDEDVLLLSLRDLPPLDEGEVYQLWLIDGDAVNPSVAFAPSADLAADTQVAVAANPDQVQTLAITREPGPIGSVAPTTKPILLAEV